MSERIPKPVLTWEETVEFLRNLQGPEGFPLVRKELIAKALKRIPPLSSKRLLEANGKSCLYCGEMMELGTTKQPTKDHVIPKSKAPKGLQNNILIVCQTCNNNKDQLTLEEWLIILIEANDPRIQYVTAVIESRPKDAVVACHVDGRDLNWWEKRKL